MTTQRTHPIMRRPAAISRRTSLTTLGGAALAAAAGGGFGAEAKKNKKNRKKNKGNERCKRQVDECQEIVTSFCTDAPNPAACEARFRPCCDSLADCQADSFVMCIDEVIPGEAPP